MNGMKKLMIFLAIGFNVSCLMGCKTCSPTTVTKIEMIPPPSALLVPCVKPQYREMKTNEDLIQFANSAVMAYEMCSAQINALRIYYGLDLDKVE